MKRILIVVGMQNDHVTGPLSFDGASSVIEPIRKKIDLGKWDTVRFVVDCYNTKDRYMELAESKHFPAHCIEGEDGAKIVPELADHPWLEERVPFEKDAPGWFISGVIQNDAEAMVWDPWTNRGQEYEIHVVGIRASCSVISMAVTIRTQLPCARIVLDADCIADESKEKLDAAFVVAKSIFCEVENGENKEKENDENA